MFVVATQGFGAVEPHGGGGAGSHGVELLVVVSGSLGLRAPSSQADDRRPHSSQGQGGREWSTSMFFVFSGGGEGLLGYNRQEALRVLFYFYPAVLSEVRYGRVGRPLEGVQVSVKVPYLVARRPRSLKRLERVESVCWIT